MSAQKNKYPHCTCEICKGRIKSNQKKSKLSWKDIEVNLQKHANHFQKYIDASGVCCNGCYISLKMDPYRAILPKVRVQNLTNESLRSVTVSQVYFIFILKTCEVL